MKYCTKCGKQIMDEAVICPHCGCETGYHSGKLSGKKAADIIRLNRKVFTAIEAVILFVIALLPLIKGIFQIDSPSIKLSLIDIFSDLKARDYFSVCLFYFLLVVILIACINHLFVNVDDNKTIIVRTALAFIAFMIMTNGIEKTFCKGPLWNVELCLFIAMFVVDCCKQYYILRKSITEN